MSTPENIAIASLRNLYRIKAFRLGFKFSVNLFILKAIDDAFHYMIYGNYMKLPRYFQVQGAQHPLNPPLLIPYPFEKTTQQIFDMRDYNELTKKMYKIGMQWQYNNRLLYTNHPWVENQHEIDNFLKYLDHQRVFQPVYYRVLQKMKDRGIQIPDGVSLKIRQLQQHKLNFHTPLVPQL